MKLSSVICVCALVMCAAADTKFPDGTYIQHFTPSSHSLTANSHYQPSGHHPQAFGVQTGYEGFLVPTKSTTTGSGWRWQHGLLAAILPIAKLVTFPFTSGVWIVGILTLLIGSALFCTFTPFCGFSLLRLGRTYLNQDKLNSATAFVLDAIEKHRERQDKLAAKQSKGSKQSKETKDNKETKVARK